MRIHSVILLFFGGLLAGCVQAVKVEAPEEPIKIDVHVKIEHEIRVRVEKELEEIFTEESGLF